MRFVAEKKVRGYNASFIKTLFIHLQRVASSLEMKKYYIVIHSTSVDPSLYASSTFITVHASCNHAFVELSMENAETGDLLTKLNYSG
jgi:hypothetical protein